MSTMPMQTRDQRRRQMHRLDACLNLLEDANERDEQVVTRSMVTMIGPHAPGVSAGMPIAQAIELVLEEQEQQLRPAPSCGKPVRAGCLAQRVAAAPAVGRDSEGPLDANAARELTERIRHATRQVCMLLLEAHRRQAWVALGYRRWAHYVHAEFGLSRSRSYQLLDQGRVIRAIRSAAGIQGTLDISAYAAEQIKPRLASVVDVVRARTAGRSEVDARQIVAEIVHLERSAFARGRMARRALTRRELPATAGGDDLGRLYEAVTNLSSMPAPARTAALVPERQARRLLHLRAAVSWLTEFAQAWESRHSSGDARTARPRHALDSR